MLELHLQLADCLPLVAKLLLVADCAPLVADCPPLVAAESAEAELSAESGLAEAKIPGDLKAEAEA